MNEKKADILSDIDETKRTVVLHGCNCFHTMGAGIALYLRRMIPEVAEVDAGTVYGDKNKLGTCSVANITSNFVVLNCYTQYSTACIGNNVPVDYEAVASCLRYVAEHYKGWEIRTPKIGCGLAGGDWNKVSAMFNHILGDQDVTVYYI